MTPICQPPMRRSTNAVRVAAEAAAAAERQVVDDVRLERVRDVARCRPTSRRMSSVAAEA